MKELDINHVDECIVHIYAFRRRFVEILSDNTRNCEWRIDNVMRVFGFVLSLIKITSLPRVPINILKADVLEDFLLRALNHFSLFHNECIPVIAVHGFTRYSPRRVRVLYEFNTKAILYFFVVNLRQRVNV